MSLVWLLNWWNLVFLLPFGLALLYLGLYTLTGISFGDGDADLGADADADADLHADTDLQHDLQADADADHDADHDAGAGHSGAMALLSWLGVGRVPLSILLMVLLMFWGSIGFGANVLLRPTTGDSWRAALVSLPAAAAGATLLTRVVVLFMARWLPLNESSARRRHDLLGSVGEAVYDIDATFGLVGVRESGGDLYQVPCRVMEDAPPIPKGSRVKLVAYGGPQGVFYVTPYEQTPENPTVAAVTGR